KGTSKPANSIRDNVQCRWYPCFPSLPRRASASTNRSASQQMPHLELVRVLFPTFSRARTIECNQNFLQPRCARRSQQAAAPFLSGLSDLRYEVLLQNEQVDPRASPIGPQGYTVRRKNPFP